MASIQFNAKNLPLLATLLKEYPKEMSRNLAVTFAQIRNRSQQAVRSEVAEDLNVRAKGLDKTFKAKSTDPQRATDPSKLFIDIFTRWKAAEVHQRGGTITAHGGFLTVLTDLARGATGRRKWTQASIRQGIVSGQLKIIPTPRGAMVVNNKTSITKTGKLRNGSRMEIIAWLRRSVHLKKRLRFYETVTDEINNSEGNIAEAIERTLVQLAKRL